MQRGFHEKLGSQCGYCTPGFIMASAGLLRRNPQPSEDEIRAALGSNICRCTGYVKIIEAVAVRLARLLRMQRWRPHHERDRATPAPHRRLCALGGRAGEGLRPRQVHRRLIAARACWSGASIAAPTRMPRSSRSTPRGGKAAGRDGDRDRRRLRQDLRRAADRAQRASAGARQGALQGRAGGGGGRRRRGDGGQGASA